MDQNGDDASSRQDPFDEAEAFINPIKRYIEGMEKAKARKRLDKLLLLKELIEEHVIEHAKSQEVHNKLKDVVIPSKLNGEPVVILKGDANCDYDRLFGGCLESATTKVVVEEPYMNFEHYVENLVGVIEVVVRAKMDGKCSVRSMLLITSETIPRTVKLLEELRASMLQHKSGITLETEALPPLAPGKAAFRVRHIRFLNDSDYGWSISLQRGLHYFEPTAYYGIGTHDFSLRVAREDCTMNYSQGHHKRFLPPAPSTLANGALHGGLPQPDKESYTSQVPRVSPPISAPPSADQFGVFEPNQLNVAVGMASLRPPGFEQPRYGVPPSVQAVSSPQPFAQQSTSATAGYQYSTPRPPNPFACSLVASKKVADAAASNSPATATGPSNSTFISRTGAMPDRSTAHGGDVDPQAAARVAEPSRKPPICKFFMHSGTCPNKMTGCSYAHAEAASWNLAKFYPNYKTSNCATYRNGQYCFRNVFCAFIHNETPEQLKELRAGKSLTEVGIVRQRRPDAQATDAQVPAEGTPPAGQPS